METILNTIGQAFNYLLYAKVADIFDIIIIAFVIYQFIALIRKTNSNRIAKGVVVILLILWISDWFKLTVVNYLLTKTFEIGIIALVILFQPELRRVLEHVGTGKISEFLRGDKNVELMDVAITQTVFAFETMSSTKTGALVVFERVNKLEAQMQSGTIINSNVSSELMKNIFFNKAPLHDGALIISGGKISAAGCVLPLSANPNLSRDLGMRHRAGIGMSEHSDAVVAIVSEETGAISVAIDGMLKRHLSPQTFEKILRNELISQEKETDDKSLPKWLKRIKNGK